MDLLIPCLRRNVIDNVHSDSHDAILGAHLDVKVDPVDATHTVQRAS